MNLKSYKSLWSSPNSKLPTIHTFSLTNLMKASPYSSASASSPQLQFVTFTYLLYVVPYHTCGGQKTTSRVGSLLPPREPWGWNASRQAWQQTLWPAALSYWPCFLTLCVLLYSLLQILCVLVVHHFPHEASIKSNRYSIVFCSVLQFPCAKQSFWQIVMSRRTYVFSYVVFLLTVTSLITIIKF